MQAATDRFEISLALIARDESRSIVRCLESVRDHVDEMVVLDTGSTDDTVALAEAAGAVVHHFSWVDDFSAARNAAIAHCTGDWILVLDADEWLVSGAEALASLRSTRPTFAGLVEWASHSEEMVSVHSVVRVLPAGTRYTGRIHEQPVIGDDVRKLPVRIDHDGSMAEQRDRKAGRNLALLQTALADEPDNAYLWFQLGSEHQMAGDATEACRAFERARRLSDPTGPSSPLWRHRFVVAHLTALMAAGRSQDAIDLAFSELENWQDSADFQFVLGHALLLHAVVHPDLQEDVIPLVEQAWQTCLALGDSPYSGAVVGRGSFLAAGELVRLYEMLGRESEASRFRPLAQPQR